MKRMYYQTLTLILMVYIFIGAAYAQKTAVLENYSKLPLTFTKNSGQLDSRVKFSTHGGGAAMFFTHEGTTFLFHRRRINLRLTGRETEASINYRSGRMQAKGIIPAELDISDDNKSGKEYEYYALKLHFVDANNNPEVIGEDRLPWNNNYFIGNDPDKWRTEVPNYSKVRLKNIYDGIDLVYYGNKNTVKYDFVVQPGANPDYIFLKYDSKDSGLLKINNDALEVNTPFGKIIEQKPYSYQIIDGNKIEVDVRYEITDREKNMYKFSVGKYNPAYILVIDPVLVYSTFIGGCERDEGYGIAVDAGGNIYITGFTMSTNFPATPGAFDESLDGWNRDVFVSKLNSSGSSLVYATYLGGNILDRGNDISVDAGGSVYITGFTNSKDFPITLEAFDISYNGDYDVFVSKLSPDGSELVYSTFLGDSLLDYGNGIAVDESGIAYVTGITNYTDFNIFPTTPGAYNEIHNGNYDVFVTKLNSSGSALIYSTFLGGDGRDEGNSIKVDAGGNAYIAGFTQSKDFPATPGAFDENNKGDYDVFVTKLNSSGSSLVYSTFIGGNNYDYGSSIALDAGGNAYITGYTLSNNFPTTQGAYDKNHTGLYDVFVSILNLSGSELLYSTYLGGSSTDSGRDIAVDEEGNVYVAGYTNSGNFPITTDALQASHNGGIYDIFISQFHPSVKELSYSTYFGGCVRDECYGITLDTGGSVYITGKTDTTGFKAPFNDFPITSGAFDKDYSGISDTFVSKLILDSTVSGINDDKIVLKGYRLFENYPNPFNPETTIGFDIPVTEYVTISIYNIAGQMIKTLVSDYMPASNHIIVWDGTNDDGHKVSSGVYLYRMTAGKFSAVKKMLLIK